MKTPNRRVLRQVIDGAYIFAPENNQLNLIEETSGGGAAGTPIQHSGWEIRINAQPAASSAPYAVNRQYIDLAGFLAEDLTFFPESAQVQSMGMPLTTGAAFTMYELITVKPLTDEDCDRFAGMASAGIFGPPGSNVSFHLLQDVIYGRWQVYNQSSDTSTSQLVQSGSWGLMTPTARDRIFVTRLVFAPMTQNNATFIQPCAFVLSGTIDEEKELVHIERMRRNYELNQTTDVDL